MNTIEKVKRFKAENGLSGASRELFKDINFILNPREFIEPREIRASAPLIRTADGREIQLTQLTGSREFDDHDREAMRQFGISESDYRKHRDKETVDETPALVLGEPVLNFKESLDKSLGLSSEDYTRYDY